MNAPFRNADTDILAALAFIPPHNRDTWVRVGMAIKSELGEVGFAVWDSWSQAADSYHAKAARSVWKSIKAGGKVTIASLFHEAMQHGWQPAMPYTSPSPEQMAAIALERAEAEAEAERIKQAQRAAAKAKAQELWKRADAVTADHAYIAAKGIRPDGAKQLRDVLVLPIRAGRELVNLQLIGADGGKRFLTGGQVKGAALVLGTLKGASDVLLCEGWATACSLREATGWPVVVAFNAGNLPVIAERLAKAFSDMALLVAGDADASGTGQQAAILAASRYPGARWLVPAFTSEQIDQHHQASGKVPSDFNDMHQLAGLDAIRQALSVPVDSGEKQHSDMSPYAAIPMVLAEASGDSHDKADIAKTDGNHENDGNQATKPSIDEGSDSAGSVPAADLPDRNHGNFAEKQPVEYLLIERGDRPGLYWLDPEGKDKPRWLCGPLKVEAKTRDGGGSNWGRLLSWRDAEDRPHRWAMPAELTCGDGSDLARELARNGLDIDPTRRSRERIIAYIVRANPGRFVRSTSKTGWHGRAFVLHDEVIGNNAGEGVFLQTDRDCSLGMAQSGTLDEWREQVAMLASGNSRMVFALSLAFAAPLAELANESGGFHLIGASSAGKSTALEGAASVWGSPAEYGFKWRATSNGMEGLCASRNDLLVILDELAQVDPREAGEAAYLIANGQGKARANRSGAIRSPSRWRVLLLSAGEISLGQHMQEVGKQTRAGQEIRLVDIQADAGAGLGLFETLNGEASGAALSQRIKTACRRYHGTAGRAFLAKLTSNQDEVVAIIRQGQASFMADDVPPDASGQAVRVAGRFALVATAGEIATAWGLTGWQEGEAITAAARLFNEWLVHRGGAGDAETRAGLAAVRAFLESHGESRFTPWDADPAAAARTINRAGFKRLKGGGLWFYVLPAAFKNDLCKGFNSTHVAKEMAARGWLKIQATDRTTYKARLPGMGNKPSNVYLLTPAIWEDGE